MKSRAVCTKHNRDCALSSSGKHRLAYKLVVALSGAFLSCWPAAAQTSLAKAFVYTEVQNSVPFNGVPWVKSNPVIAANPGFLYKTWFSGLGTHSVGGFYAFDSIENAKRYVTEWFPENARRQGVAHATRVFDATVVAEANRDMGSVDFGGTITSKPGAFVYTEVQVNMPFSKVAWKQRNPVLKQTPGLLSKTWLSGLDTNTVGGVYAFDTIESARRFTVEAFPKIAKEMNAASYTRIFDASVVEEAARGMKSPYFR
jgi:hypothetical protein